MPKQSSNPNKKARWSTAKKAERRKPTGGPGANQPFRQAREERRGHGEVEPRRPRRFEERGERPRRFDDERPRRFEDRDDRPRRTFGERDDRPRRFENRDDRPKRVDRQGRPTQANRWDRDDRPRRTFGDRDDRQRRRFDDRAPARHDEHDAESERMEADTWTKATRTSATGPVEVSEDNGFAALGLPPKLVERLARDGITSPFPIQAATVPDALNGKDVLGRGQTGSGKTLAFGLPLLTRLDDGQRAHRHRPRALILSPTRELAMQISDALEPLVHVLGLRHRLVAGGLSYTNQINALERGVEVLIATPGRLQDLRERGVVELDEVEVVVLDEADHMADMGFLPTVTDILDAIPETAQKLLFSATLDSGIDELVTRYLVDPVVHSTDDATASVETMEHHILLIDPQDKKVITAHVANRSGRTVVFCRTKLGADRVARQLREEGVMAAALHGGLTQGARNRVLGAFRDGTLPVLVATDVAARGIHVDDVSVVLQADPPADHKDYLHRAGRTARAGEEGAVFTLALPHQKRQMQRIAREAGVEVEPVKVAPGDPVLEAAGATPTSGEPISEESFRRLVDPPRRGGRPGAGRGGYGRGGQGREGARRGGGRGGYRDGGHRESGSRDGGYRPRRSFGAE